MLHGSCHDNGAHKLLLALSARKVVRDTGDTGADTQQRSTIMLELTVMTDNSPLCLHYLSASHHRTVTRSGADGQMNYSKFCKARGEVRVHVSEGTNLHSYLPDPSSEAQVIVFCRCLMSLRMRPVFRLKTRRSSKF
jgi:hypothetical protein